MLGLALLLVTLVPVLSPTARTQSVAVAAHDLAAGSAVVAGDVRMIEVAADLVPDGAHPDAQELLGRRPRAPIASGQPLTDVLLEPAGRDSRPADTVLVALPVEPAIRARLGPGVQVDLVLGLPEDESVNSVSVRATVIGLEEGSDPDGTSGSLSWQASSGPQALIALPLSRWTLFARATREGWVMCAVVG